MTYWGANKDQLKFRCPHATGKVDCPLGMAACSSSNYGMVVKINVNKIILVFSGLLCISFSIFMFSPAGYQFTAKLSNYWF